jgi:hypothetical protein
MGRPGPAYADPEARRNPEATIHREARIVISFSCGAEMAPRVHPS